MLATKSAESLSTHKFFSESAREHHAADKSARAGSIGLFVRPEKLAELLSHATPSREKTADDSLAAARRLGLEGLESIWASVLPIETNPAGWELQARVVVPRPLPAALQLLDIRPGEQPKLPSWIGADMTGTWLWNWDFASAVKGFGSWFDEANEPGPDGVGMFSDLLDGLRDDPEGVRVDLRRDLFGSIGSQAVQFTDDRGRTADGKSTGRWLIALSARDTDKITATLTRFYRDDKRVQHKRDGQYDVWTIGENGSLFVEGENHSFFTLHAIAVGDGQLLLSSDAQLVHTAITGQCEGPQLTSDAVWAKLLQGLEPWDKSTAAAGLVRLDRVLEPGYAAVVAAKPGVAQTPMPRVWRLFFFGTIDPAASLPTKALPRFCRSGPCCRNRASRFRSPTTAGEWSVAVFRQPASRHRQHHKVGRPSATTKPRFGCSSIRPATTWGSCGQMTHQPPRAASVNSCGLTRRVSSGNVSYDRFHIGCRWARVAHRSPMNKPSARPIRTERQVAARVPPVRPGT